jgi:hypothetical protein
LLLLGAAVTSGGIGAFAYRQKVDNLETASKQRSHMQLVGREVGVFKIVYHVSLCYILQEEDSSGAVASLTL